MKRFKKEIVIACMVIISAIILVYGIDYLKGINIFHTTNYYFVTYKDVNGLNVSAPVYINGFKIGQVREINYDFEHPGNVIVELDVDPKLKLTKGTKAVLGSSLLGTASITLIPGQNAAYIKVGDSVEGVIDAGLMTSLTENMMPAVENLLPKVDSLLTAVTTLVSDPALLMAVHRLDNISAGLESSTASLAQAMKPMPSMMNNASDAMVDVKGVIANLDRISADLAAVSAQLKEAPIESTLDNVGKLSENLLALSKQLNEPNSSLGLLMRDPKLYNNLNSCVAHIDSILVDVKRKPKDYIPPIKLF